MEVIDLTASDPTSREVVDLTQPLTPPPSPPKEKKKTPLGPRLRNFCFTLNNWTQEEYNQICSTECQWMIVAKETAPDTGTPHLQGAVVLGAQKAQSTVKKWPGWQRAHLEKMIGTPLQSITYCSKQDPDPFVKGSLPQPGKRNDIHSAVEKIMEGATLSELAQSMEGAVSIVKYSRGLTFLRSLTSKVRTSPPQVYWLYGSTGTGKTRYSYDFAKDYYNFDIWTSSRGIQWFDGYEGQKVALIDDFRSKHTSGPGGGFAFLLQLLDRYPLRVPVKGGFVNWSPEVIFITTPDAPDVTFASRGQHLPEDLAQLHRRITATYLFPGDLQQANDNAKLRNSRVEATSSSEEAKADEEICGLNNGGGGSTPPQIVLEEESSGSSSNPRPTKRRNTSTIQDSSQEEANL